MSMSLQAQKESALALKGVFTASDWSWEDGSPAIWSYWMNVSSIMTRIAKPSFLK